MCKLPENVKNTLTFRVTVRLCSIPFLKGLKKAVHASGEKRREYIREK